MGSTVWRECKFVLAASATALAATGLLTEAAPPRAHAACDQYAFNGEFRLVQSDGAQVAINSGKVTQNVSGEARFIGGSYLQSPAPASGQIRGRNIHLDVDQGPPGGHWIYDGTVGDDGIARGKQRIEGNRAPLPPLGSGTWEATTPLVCYGSPAPAPPPAEMRTSEITLRCGPPTLVGITAYVGLTNNDGEPPTNCTYSDGVNPPRPFTVTGSVETPIDIAGIPTGTTYHVTVTCGFLTYNTDKTF